MNIANWGAIDSPTAIGLLIGLKSVSVAVRRGATTLGAQTVRLETLSGQKIVQGEGGQTHQIDALLLGYRDHPTVADTDIQVGDRFTNDGVAYDVVAVMPAHVDCVQVYLRVRT